MSVIYLIIEHDLSRHAVYYPYKAYYSKQKAGDEVIRLNSFNKDKNKSYDIEEVILGD